MACMGIRMDLKQIRYAVAAAECRSFRRAAQQLRVQQSAVSKRIGDLEARLGVKLFNRTPNGVALTEAGNCFVSLVRKGLAQFESAATLARAMGRGEFGIVRIGVSSPLAAPYLSDLAAAHRAREPGIRLDWNEGTQPDHMEAVIRHDLDAAIIVGTPPVEGCETLRLWEERVFVALPAGERLAGTQEIPWKDLCGQHFIVSDAAHGRHLHDYLIRHAADLNGEITVEQCRVQRDSLLHLVAWGRGFALITESQVDRHIAGVVYRPLATPSISFSAIWSRTNESVALKNFIGLARALSMSRGV